MRIHAAYDPDDDHRAMLEAAVPDITWGREVPEGLDVLVRGVPSEANVAALNPDAALVIPYSGVPGKTRDRLADRPDVRVYNLHHNAELVAEHAVALLLGASRRIVPAHTAMAAGDWRMRWAPDASPLLRGHRAVIVGFGAIGQRVGTALEGLGMSVVPIRSDTPRSALDDALADARAVILAAPLTPRTEGLFDAARLARLPATAVLVNVARAALCDEAALYAALSEGRLFGAGLDVWWRYPSDEAARADTPPAEQPFHTLDNVVLSPHRAGHAAETERLRGEHLAALLTTLLAGNEPATRVDLARGY